MHLQQKTKEITIHLISEAAVSAVQSSAIRPQTSTWHRERWDSAKSKHTNSKE